ncbi:MAG TPA: hypothetical protein VFK44_09870 [Bacillales bacterium]|nr:hypothetical protein [Bacillales bacterium]
MTIAFDREPEALKAGVWKNHDVQFTPISGDSVKLPDEPHPFIYVIHAKWKKGEADYAMKITWQEEKE